MLVSAFLVSSLTLATLQHGRRPHQDPDQEKIAERVSIEARDGLMINAEYYQASPDPRTPLLVLYHQARSGRAEYRPIAPRLKELGYDCLAVDLRSGQASGGVPNLTAKVARDHGQNPTYLDALPDIEDSLAWARANHPQAKIVAWGSSYSASLVLVLAATSPKLLDGALAFAPGEYFTALGKPATWVRDTAQKIHCPVFLTASRSEQGEWQPIFDAIPDGPKKSFVPEAEGAHGSRALWDETEGNEEYWKAVEAFLKEQFPPPAATDAPAK